MKKIALLLMLLLAGAVFSPATDAHACDLCAIYSAQNIKDFSAGHVTAGVTEQLSSFNSVRLNGEWVPNTGHQSLSSSTTQLYGRYDFTDRVGAQLNLPFVSRDFKRIEDGELKKGSESGIGDMSILAIYSPLRISEDDFFARVSIRGGVKLPTGDSDRLREETEEGDEQGEAHGDEHETERSPTQILAHSGSHGDSEAIPSAIHGHDLALGSGSLDYIVGVSGFVEKGAYFALADLQYAFRTEGDFDYRYQNDLLWSLGAGRYLLTEHEGSLSLKANLSGEYKGMDIFDGNKADDTGINSIFLGPELDFTIGERVSGLAAVDLPLLLDNTAFQAVPDYRLRFGITYRF